MRVAVFGAGGTGGYLGARLACGGLEVAVVARGAHLEAIRRHGLRVEGPRGGFTVAPVLATDDAAQVGTADVVLLGVKAWQVPEAARALRPLLGPETAVVTLQNGVEAPFQVAEALGAAHALAGVCQFSSRVEGPGVIRHGGSLDPELEVGALEPRAAEQARRVAAAFTRAGVPTAVPQDIQVALWLKLAAICSRAGVGAVTRAPVGVWRALPPTRRLAEEGAGEVESSHRGQGQPSYRLCGG